VSPRKYSKRGGSSRARAVVEVPAEVVVVCAATVVEVEGPGSVVDVEGSAVGELVQDDSTAAASAAQITFDDEIRLRRLPPKGGLPNAGWTHSNRASLRR